MSHTSNIYQSQSKCNQYHQINIIFYSPTSSNCWELHISTNRATLQNDTMRIIYMYHENEPVQGSVVPGSLPNPQLAFKGYIPLSLTQRTHDEQRRTDDVSSSSSSSNSNNSRGKFMTNTMELRNEDVTLPEANDETLYWCKVFELPARSQKQHLIKVCSFAPKSSFKNHFVFKGYVF